ncbi:hypothetical protein LguiB_034946 [Lonicera macranthoides]
MGEMTNFSRQLGGSGSGGGFRIQSEREKMLSFTFREINYAGGGLFVKGENN